MNSQAYTAFKQDAGDVEEAFFVKTSRSEIPEAHELTWTDTYFEETKTEGVIAVFDLDYDLARKRIRFHQRFLLLLTFVFYLIIFYIAETFDDYGYGDVDISGVAVFVSVSVYIICICGLVACKLEKMFLSIQGCHLAVTQEGILKVTNGFPFGSFFRTTTMVCYVLFVLSCIFVELNSIDTRTHIFLL
jgi:hypothetical protein